MFVVNMIYFYIFTQKGMLTVLLCGEMGLIFSLEQALIYGSTPRLAKQPYFWNVLGINDVIYHSDKFKKNVYI